MSWTVYIIECADKTLYTGITNDLERRFTAHKNGRGAKYTRSRGPLKLVYTEPARTKSMALKREAFIKSLRRELKLEFVRKRSISTGKHGARIHKV